MGANDDFCTTKIDEMMIYEELACCCHIADTFGYPKYMHCSPFVVAKIQ